MFLVGSAWSWAAIIIIIIIIIIISSSSSSLYQVPFLFSVTINLTYIRMSRPGKLTFTR